MRTLFLISLVLPVAAQAAAPVGATVKPMPPAQAALARELAVKVNRFQEAWEQCPDARLRGPATGAFRRWVAESVDYAGDKNARRRWLRNLRQLDARQFGADAGGALVVVSSKTCKLAVTPWPTSVLVGGAAEPEDLLSTAVSDAEESSATPLGTAVPSYLFVALEESAIEALAQGRLLKPFVAYDRPEKAPPLKKGGYVVRLAVAPGASAGPGREFQEEGLGWRWNAATAFAGCAEVPDKLRSVADILASVPTLKDAAAWKSLVEVAQTVPLLPTEWRRFVELGATGGLSENARRALLALTRDGTRVTDVPPAEAVEVIGALAGVDETLDRRIVQRLLPAWLLANHAVPGWLERIGKAHADAVLDGWSSILDDDDRLATAWVGLGSARKTVMDRAVERDLPESMLRRLAEVARVDREPTVRAATAAIDYAMCVRQSGAGLAARCGLYGVMLGLLVDPDARVRYAAQEQVRYRVQVRGHRFTLPAEWQTLLGSLPTGPAEISVILPLLKVGADEEAFARWVRSSEGRNWVTAITESTAPGIGDLRQWTLDHLGEAPPPPTQAGAGIPQNLSGNPIEFDMLAQKVKAVVPPVGEPAPRQPAAVEPTVSTIDRVVDLSDSPDAAEARRGGDEENVGATPLMPGK